MVNEVPVQRQALCPGDQIRIGETLLVFEG
jgi:pSer/pThr/pTyr-binding forkhead associated (FHA) protein